MTSASEHAISKDELIQQAGEAAFNNQLKEDPRAPIVDPCFQIDALSVGLPPDALPEINKISQDLWRNHLLIHGEAHLSANDLAQKYQHWPSHPVYSSQDWAAEASAGDTRRSYWDWVAASIERDCLDIGDASPEAPLPQPNHATLTLDFYVSIEDEALLRSFLKQRGDTPACGEMDATIKSLIAHPANQDTIETTLLMTVFNPADKPETVGFTVTQSIARRIKNNDFVVSIECQITDPASLYNNAVNRYRPCWFDPYWRPATAGEAIYEILFASNDNPSNDLIGIVATDWKASNDHNFLPPE